jgi:hypothetical protein
MRSAHFRLLMAAVVVIVLVSCAAMAPAATITVKPGDMNGWTVGTQSAGTNSPVWTFTVAGTGPPPEGTGSFHFFTEGLDGSDPLEKIYLGTNNHSGVSLRDITSFKYYTYLHSATYNPAAGWPDGQPPIVEIITTSGPPGGTGIYQQRRFVYKPYGWMGESSVAFDTWQEWDMTASDSNGRWEKIGPNDAAKDVFGNWNWVINRYGTVADPMRFATPVVGDYVDGYNGDYKYGNESGTSISIRVGSGQTSDWMLNRSTSTWERKPWWKESCGIDAYADKLVIGINGVETVYDFESTNGGVVGIRPGECRDKIIGKAKNNFFFAVFGRVMDLPGPSGTEFYLDDGTGVKIKVIATNTAAAGEYYRAKGTLEWNSGDGRYDLRSTPFDTYQLY